MPELREKSFFKQKGGFFDFFLLFLQKIYQNVCSLEFLLYLCKQKGESKENDFRHQRENKHFFKVLITLKED
jgi:hypothetical protein